MRTNHCLNGAQRRGTLGECGYRLAQLLKQFNNLRSGGAKRCSSNTSSGRAQVLRRAMKDLHTLGFKLRDPANLTTKHVSALAGHWENRGLSASEIQKRFSCLRTFCAWIGKAGMVEGAEKYLKDPRRARRSYVAQKSKSWMALGVDIQVKIREVAAIDLLVAVQLALQSLFGLRAREAWCLHPELADKKNYLAVNWGTKGGRDRTVPITSKEQRQLLDYAKKFANGATGSLIPASRSLKAWSAHFYRACRRVGISRATGVLPHGLRHGEAQNIYKAITGFDPSVVDPEAKGINPALDRFARQVVAETLGHSRLQIAGAYLGPALAKRIERRRGRNKPTGRANSPGN